jgi:hypothetical protein
MMARLGRTPSGAARLDLGRLASGPDFHDTQEPGDDTIRKMPTGMDSAGTFRIHLARLHGPPFSYLSSRSLRVSSLAPACRRYR